MHPGDSKNGLGSIVVLLWMHVCRQGANQWALEESTLGKEKRREKEIRKKEKKERRKENEVRKEKYSKRVKKREKKYTEGRNKEKKKERKME